MAWTELEVKPFGYNTFSTTLTNAIAIGDVVMVVGDNYDSLANISSITIAGCAMSQRALIVNGVKRSALWGGNATAAGATSVAVTRSSVSDALRLWVIHLRPAAGATLAWVTPATGTGTSTTPGAGPVSPTAGRNVYLVLNFCNLSSVASSVSGGFTLRSRTGNTTGCDIATLNIAGASGTYSGAFTTSSDDWSALLGGVEEIPPTSPLTTMCITNASVVVSSTSNVREVLLLNPATFVPITGLTPTGLTCRYGPKGGTMATRTLVAGTLNTFVSLGIIEIDATNRPGWYQFSMPNADVTANGNYVYGFGGTGWGIIDLLVFGSDPYAASVSAGAVATAVNTSIFSQLVEPGLTFMGWLRVCGAWLAGKTTAGASSNSEAMRSMRNDGTPGKTRLTSTNDGTNRTGATYDTTDEV